MDPLIFATGNPAKIIELQAFIHAHGMPINVIGQRDAGIVGEAVEDADTLEGNSLKKAQFALAQTNHWVIAEDAGICIDALHGAPGVRSARFAGEGASAKQIIDLVLAKMQMVELDKRTAHFMCVFTLVSPAGEVHQFVGRTNGHILEHARPVYHERFPYDALFVPEGETRTYGEMTHEEKNMISHRGKALIQLHTWLSRKRDSDTAETGA